MDKSNATASPDRPVLINQAAARRHVRVMAVGWSADIHVVNTSTSMHWLSMMW